jgi:hypothetical protein
LDQDIATDHTLADTTISSLRAFFAQSGHRPSGDHWEALRDIAATMERMADGCCEPKVFLSAVDPGVGKTQTVVHFARALIADPMRRQTGMVVCVGRISEAVAFAGALGADRKHFAILTGDAVANALGSDTPSAAQILITTQQRIERVCDGHTFGSAQVFWHRGAPRAVRVWDEAWLPGCTVTMGCDDLLLLVRPVRAVSGALADALWDFAEQLRHRQNGGAIDVPDFAANHGVPLYDLLAATSERRGKLRDDQETALTALRVLSGRRARILRDNRTGATMLSYRNTLPADLAPLVVLDASARVRHTYSFMEEYRRNVVRLATAVKDYSPLQVHVWRTGGGKSAFESNGDVLIEGIVKTILSKPDEGWLVVAHKAGGRLPDMSRKVRKSLPDDIIRENVKFTTWGNHMATNDFVEVPNVILAGTLFCRKPHYAALTHLAQNYDVAAGPVSDVDVRRTEQGEHANLILQALCRGRVRKSDGSRCLPMSAFVIASNQSRIPDHIADIFPGCTVQEWRPHKREPRGRVLQALQAIAALLLESHWLSYRDVARAIGMHDWRNFKRQVIDRDDWPGFLIERGYEEEAGPRRARGVRLKGGVSS